MTDEAKPRFAWYAGEDRGRELTKLRDKAQRDADRCGAAAGVHAHDWNEPCNDLCIIVTPR